MYNNYLKNKEFCESKTIKKNNDKISIEDFINNLSEVDILNTINFDLYLNKSFSSILQYNFVNSAVELNQKELINLYDSVSFEHVYKKNYKELYNFYNNELFYNELTSLYLDNNIINYPSYVLSDGITFSISLKLKVVSVGYSNGVVINYKISNNNEENLNIINKIKVSDSSISSINFLDFETNNYEVNNIIVTSIDGFINEYNLTTGKVLSIYCINYNIYSSCIYKNKFIILGLNKDLGVYSINIKAIINKSKLTKEKVVIDTIIFEDLLVTVDSLGIIEFSIIKHSNDNILYNNAYILKTFLKINSKSTQLIKNNKIEMCKIYNLIVTGISQSKSIINIYELKILTENKIDAVLINTFDSYKNIFNNLKIIYNNNDSRLLLGCVCINKIIIYQLDLNLKEIIDFNNIINSNTCYININCNLLISYNNNQLFYIANKLGLGCITYKYN